jgi:hypothetical protein
MPLAPVALAARELAARAALVGEVGARARDRPLLAGPRIRERHVDRLAAALMGPTRGSSGQPATTRLDVRSSYQMYEAVARTPTPL